MAIFKAKNPFHKLQLWYFIKKIKFKSNKNLDPYIEHAKREFKTVGYIPLDQKQEDGPNKWIQENIIELLDVFNKQGHSATSAEYCINMFSKLAKFEPLCPLLGDDSEWNKIDLTSSFDKPMIYQNNRCSHVFKENDITYDINGYIFWHWAERELYEDEDRYPGTTKYKSYFTSKYSRKIVDFPYTPEIKYIEVESYEVNEDDNNIKEPGSGFWYTKYPENIIEEYERTFK